MVDIGEALDLIDDLVETYGEDHTAIGTYLDEGNQPHCGVGMVLHRLGVSIDTLRANNGTRFSLLSNDHLGVDLTVGARTVLNVFQETQDGQHYPRYDCTWGSARKAAHEGARRIEGKLLDLVPDSSLSSLA